MYNISHKVRGRKKF